jgi:antitoxin component HigA of HigAB toxin-antitoxin module
MTVQGIQNDEEYRRALRTASMLVDLDPAPGSPHGNRLTALVQLIEQYEATFMRDLAPRNG